MKRYLYAVVLSSILQSCIKEAPLNPEADIEAFLLDSFLTITPPVIDQASKKIYLYLKPDAYAKGIAPVLILSPGATVTPASGEMLQLDTAIYYTVTSQSGVNKKTYKVETMLLAHWNFGFEKWGEHPTGKYQFPLEESGVQVWSSGNPGIAMSGVEKKSDAYPMRATSDSYEGNFAAEIITLKGNSLSEVVGIKIFPGSLFIGEFNSSLAFVNPPGATQFGQAYSGLPKTFTGYYKYTPGTHFQDRDGNIIPGKTDRCAIYAVLYNGSEKLDGTNVSTSERIVAKAELTDGSGRTGFTRFEIPFEYTGVTPGDELMLTIVASSSAEGGEYAGAIGSRLVVDNFKIIQ